MIRTMTIEDYEQVHDLLDGKYMGFWNFERLWS